MKDLEEYILEKQNFLVKKHINQYHFFPNNKDELEKIIISQLKNGITNLNDIAVSNIEDMSMLFMSIDVEIPVKDIDISEWDVSHVIDMSDMFLGCHGFNSDLSKWDVSNVENMNNMFLNCKKFNSDLSKWNVSNVKYMVNTFRKCKNFNCDLSKWDVSNVKYMNDMFEKCVSMKKIPSWYKTR